MATTRYYFNLLFGQSPALYPTGPNWRTAHGSSHRLVTAKRPGEPQLNQSALDVWGTTLDYAAVGSQNFRIDAFPPGEVLGGFTYTTRVQRSNNPGPVDLWMRLALYSPSGALRGVLFEGTPTGTALPTAMAVRVFVGTFAAGVVQQAGDVLVVERGGRFEGAFQYWAQIDLPIRDDSTVADLPQTDGSTALGNPWLEITTIEAPEPPTGLAATPGVTILDLAWTPPATGPTPTGYTVAVNGGAPVAVGNVTTHTVAGLLPGTTYTIAVRALAGALPSTPATVEATTLDPAPRDGRWWTNRLLDALGIVGDAQPVLQVRRWAAGAWTLDADLSHALAGYAVTYGRSGPAGPTDPVKATLSLVTRHAGPVEAGTRLQVALCEPVRLALGLTAAQAVRFTGEVTDPSVNHATRLTSLVCVGRLGRANRQPLDGAGWPVEDDGDRVARILAATGMTVGAIGAGTTTLAAPTRVEPAAKLLDLVVNSTGGQVVEQPDGAVDWHDADKRRGVNSSLTLSAGEVFRSITWAQRVGEVVNDVTVKTAAGDTVRVVDPSSADPVTGYGPYPASLDTALVDEEDAYDLGTTLVGRRARPAWTLPDVQVDLIRTVDLPDLAALLGLRHGHRLTLDGLPEGCPVPGKVFVEGWTETATATAWRLTVNVSDPILSGVSVRYIDVPLTAAYNIDDVDPSLSYLDVMRIDNPADLI